mmetsp:Transcript_17617/g.39872  ORF Transcript_17617/g.39872 Transcript_17617/m.39872 type:complete len:278 (-) Transcript_17617:236-1069(-)
MVRYDLVHDMFLDLSLLVLQPHFFPIVPGHDKYLSVAFVQHVGHDHAHAIFLHGRLRFRFQDLFVRFELKTDDVSIGRPIPTELPETLGHRIQLEQNFTLGRLNLVLAQSLLGNIKIAHRRGQVIQRRELTVPLHLLRHALQRSEIFRHRRVVQHEQLMVVEGVFVVAHALDEDSVVGHVRAEGEEVVVGERIGPDAQERIEESEGKRGGGAQGPGEGLGLWRSASVSMGKARDGMATEEVGDVRRAPDSRLFFRGRRLRILSGRTIRRCGCRGVRC